MDLVKIATELVTSLVKKGFVAYFAGGFVRDLLLGNDPSDIDVATNATPDQIAQIFPRTILVGARFGVVVVIKNGHQFEVTTFRKDEGYQDGRHPSEISFSSAQEDAQRRDFTINGMFFDPLEQQLIDYVGGQEDLKKKIIRTIGNPHDRFLEDRLRILRAIRFAYRFSFQIEEKTKEAIIEFAPSLFPAVSIERVLQEFEKMAKYPSFFDALVTMHELHLLEVIFPKLHDKSVDEIKKVLLPLKDFPKNFPFILSLTLLFQNESLQEWLSIGKTLKVTNDSLKQLEFFWKAKGLFQKENTLWQWAHLYANPLFPLTLQIYSTFIPKESREDFLKSHAKRLRLLEIDIKRIQEKKPLVTALHLKQRGINPGPQMGNLLLEAEQIAINNRLHMPEDVLKGLSLKHN